MKITRFLIFLLFVSIFTQDTLAGLRLRVMTGEVENVSIHRGSATFDKVNQCISNANDGTIIYLGEIDFGTANHYNQVSVESATNLPLNSAAEFMIYIDNPELSENIPVATIKPIRVNSKLMFRHFTSDISRKITGIKPVYLVWKKHSSNLYAVNFRSVAIDKNDGLTSEAVSHPIYSPYAQSDNFFINDGFVNERYGVIEGADGLSVNLGAIDFGKNDYNKILVDISNNKNIPPDGVLEIYLDKEEEPLQPESNFTIDMSQIESEISPTMYGIFFEDINRAVDGGISAELIFNRSFEEKNLPSSCTYDPVNKVAKAPHKPVYSNTSVYRDFTIPWNIDNTHPGWTIDADKETEYRIFVDDLRPLAPTNMKSLRVEIKNYTSPFRIINSGFNGIHMKEGDEYRLTFYINAESNFNKNIIAQIVNSQNEIITNANFETINDGKWKKYETILIPNKTVNDGKFIFLLESAGNINIDFISLFPVKTFRNRENGLREDVAQLVADLKPAFVRWPGGCIVEGLTMENRVKWKNTIGDPMQRPGEYNLWGYHSTNTFGYHEFLQFCEDIQAKSVFVCNAGVSCDARNGDFYTDDELETLIQEALDAIEYATGDASTKWGAERAKNGRKEPFILDYIEVGNENHGEMYARYFNRFYNSIRKKYPEITIITAIGEHEQLGMLNKFDMNDPHFYNDPHWFYQNTNFFDRVERKGYKTYVGEYACNMSVGRGNMDAALSEAAFMIGMERNSDLVTMTSYAPLLENPFYTSTGVNMIHVKNDDVMGRSSYYVQKMFSENRPDVNIRIDSRFGEIKTDPDPIGHIGLGSYNTSVEYKNIKVIEDGKVIYESDFVNRPDEWEFIRGNWKIEDECIKQTSTNGYNIAVLKTHKFNSKKVTVEVEAIKRGGEEGFVILFGHKDVENTYQLTLGSYSNRWTIFEKYTEGVHSTLNEDRPTLNIINNREYKISLMIDNDQWACRVNNIPRLQYEHKNQQRQYAIAGLDKEKNELIIKVVNAEELPMTTTLNIKNSTGTESTGKSVTLSSSSRNDENTFNNPHLITTVEEEIAGVASTFKYTFKPLSTTILRLKLK